MVTRRASRSVSDDRLSRSERNVASLGANQSRGRDVLVEPKHVGGIPGLLEPGQPLVMPVALNGADLGTNAFERVDGKRRGGRTRGYAFLQRTSYPYCVSGLRHYQAARVF